MRRKDLLIEGNDIWLVIFIAVVTWLIVFQYGAI